MTGTDAWEEAHVIFDGVSHKPPMALSVDRFLPNSNQWRGLLTPVPRSSHPGQRLNFGVGWPEDGGWAGVAAVGQDLVFAPADADQILIINVTTPDEPRLSTVQVGDMITSSLPTAGAPRVPRGPMKWCAAAAAGTKVYFAPLLADDVLVLDVAAWRSAGRDSAQNSTFLWDVPLTPSMAKGGTSLVPSFGTQKWLGASVVNNRELVLGPSYTGMVPTLLNLDEARNRTRVKYWDASGLAGQSGQKHLPYGGEELWQGSVAYGKKVYFAPFNAESVLVVDTQDYTKDELAKMDEKMWRSGYRSDVHAYQLLTRGLPGGGMKDHAKWHGGVLSDNTIYFAPHNANSILVVDCLTDTVRQVDVPYHVNRRGKWRGAALLAGKIYFAPYNADGILIFDVKTEQSYLAGTRLLSNRTAKWMGAAVVGTRVYFAPYKAQKVLVYETMGQPRDAEESAVPSPPQALLEEHVLSLDDPADDEHATEFLQRDPDPDTSEDDSDIDPTLDDNPPDVHVAVNPSGGGAQFRGRS